MRAIGAKSDANPDLAGALRDGEGDEAIEADGGEQDRECREAGHEQGVHLVGPVLGVPLLFHRRRVNERKVGVHFTQLGTDEGKQLADIGGAGASRDQRRRAPGTLCKGAIRLVSCSLTGADVARDADDREPRQRVSLP